MRACLAMGTLRFGSSQVANSDVGFGSASSGERHWLNISLRLSMSCNGALHRLGGACLIAQVRMLSE